MDNRYAVIGLLKSIIREETKYLRHYIAQVVDNQDDQNRGRCKVICQQLGWLTPDQGVWAESRDKKSMIVPDVGKYVEIYFIGGDKNYPCYLGIVNEMQSMVTPSYKDTTKDIIFEDESMALIFDKITGIFTIQTGDASGWIPNTLPNDPFTGLPHGGIAGGIIKLQGK